MRAVAPTLLPLLWLLLLILSGRPEASLVSWVTGRCGTSFFQRQFAARVRTMKYLKLLSVLVILLLCLGTFMTESAGPKGRRICCYKMNHAMEQRRFAGHSKKKHCRPCNGKQMKYINYSGPLPKI
ncbi:hypothetical protein JRQ81_017375 [Phrynocephalus forsythii]|uniref:Uncharacterized protein n=1 Tax=Phrynocephalus forsythii TaxID=171643 RepID=A0A9Q1B0F5_9SAUR|nr:hypothetical protein JRQ81_017375 [Phrynocephalus forsythii]